MKDKVEILLHKDRQVLYADHSGRTDNDYAQKVVDLADQIVEMSKEEKMPLLVDVTGSIVDERVITGFIKAARMVNPVVTKIGVLGVHGIKKALAKVIEKTSNVNFKIFETTEEALDWLVDD